MIVVEGSSNSLFAQNQGDATELAELLERGAVIAHATVRSTKWPYVKQIKLAIISEDKRALTDKRNSDLFKAIEEELQLP